MRILPFILTLTFGLGASAQQKANSNVEMQLSGDMPTWQMVLRGDILDKQLSQLVGSQEILNAAIRAEKKHLSKTVAGDIEVLGAIGVGMSWVAGPASGALGVAIVIPLTAYGFGGHNNRLPKWKETWFVRHWSSTDLKELQKIKVDDEMTGEAFAANIFQHAGLNRILTEELESSVSGEAFLSVFGKLTSAELDKPTGLMTHFRTKKGPHNKSVQFQIVYSRVQDITQILLVGGDLDGDTAGAPYIYVHADIGVDTLPKENQE